MCILCMYVSLYVSLTVEKSAFKSLLLLLYLFDIIRQLSYSFFNRMKALADLNVNIWKRIQ